jgi:hypothetical protein
MSVSDISNVGLPMVFKTDKTHDKSWIPHTLANALCDTARLREAQQSDDEISLSRKDTGPVPGSKSATVFVKHDISNIMAAVLDRPMPSIKAQQSG